jgi:hypothetical protein
MTLPGRGRIGRLARYDAVNAQAGRGKLVAGFIDHGAQSDQNAHVEGCRILLIRIGIETVDHLIGVPWRKTLDLIADDPRQELARLRRNRDPPHYDQIGGQLKHDQSGVGGAHHLGRYRGAGGENGEILFRLNRLRSDTVATVRP